MPEEKLKDDSESHTRLKRASEEVGRVSNRLHPDLKIKSKNSTGKRLSTFGHSGIARLNITDIANDQIQSDVGLGGVREPLIRWNDDDGILVLTVDQKATLPPVALKFAEIQTFLSSHPALDAAERSGCLSSFLDIFHSKFGRIEHLSIPQFEAENNHRLALKIVHQVDINVRAVMSILTIRKQSMLIANVFKPDLNSDRLVAMFRALLSRRLRKSEIVGSAYKLVKYGPPTPKDSNIPTKSLLDDLNTELKRFEISKAKNCFSERQVKPVDILDGPPMDNLYYRYRKYSIRSKDFVLPINSIPQSPTRQIGHDKADTDFNPVLALQALDFSPIPEKFNFKKAEDPILQSHSVYTRSEWTEPKFQRTIKDGKTRYLNRNLPIKVDFDEVFARAEESRLKVTNELDEIAAFAKDPNRSQILSHNIEAGETAGGKPIPSEGELLDLRELKILYGKMMGIVQESGQINHE